ncbi:MAG: M48 family metallopeptidase [Candidatus Eisenbacteria bacterium]|nr:M48 family metallopeptidase [Candidatus Eisenbacteria bacterium]
MKAPVRARASKNGRSHASPERPKPGLTAAEKRALVERLRKDGARIAGRFGLRYHSIEAEDARVRRRYGSCHSNGVIRIRLCHAKTGRPLKYSSMIDTLCHEIAHLKYFHHGPRFRDFYEVILDWARREGIYRPTPRGTKEKGTEGELDLLARFALAIAPNVARRLASCLRTASTETQPRGVPGVSERNAASERGAAREAAPGIAGGATSEAPVRPREEDSPPRGKRRAKRPSSAREPLPQLELF